MRWQHKKNIWPYLAALGCLFLLSLFVPQSWQRLRHPETDHRRASQREAPPSDRFQSSQTEQPDQVVRLKAERVVEPLTSPSPHAMVPPELPPATMANSGQRSAVISEEDYLLAEEEEEGGVTDTFLLDPRLPSLVSPVVSEEVLAGAPPAAETGQLDVLMSLRDALAALVKQATSQWPTPPRTDPMQPSESHFSAATVQPMETVSLKTTEETTLSEKGPEIAPKKGPTERKPTKIGPAERRPTLMPPDQPTLLTVITQQSASGNSRSSQGKASLSVLDRKRSSRQSSILIHPRLRVSSEQDRLAMRMTRNLYPIPNLKPALQNAPPPSSLTTEATSPTTRPPTQDATPPGGLAPKRPTFDPLTPAGQAQKRLRHAHPNLSPILNSRPLALINSLSKLRELSQAAPKQAGQRDAANWADKVLARIVLLTRATPHAVDATAVVSQLQHLVTAGENGAIQGNQGSIHLDWLRAVRALQRRLGVWRLLASRLGVAAQESSPLSDKPTKENYHTLQQVLWQCSQLTANSSEGAAWREYLLQDSILDMARDETTMDRQWQRLLAQQVLARMDDSRLTASQRKFLAAEPMLSLRRQLRRWATGPVDLQKLAGWIEGYEQTGRGDLSQRISQCQQRLKWSSHASQQQLADQLDRHYRKANVRIVLSDKLLNRMLPKQHPIVSPVHDRVVGTEVRGRANTNTEVRVRLLPDSKAWRFTLEAEGKVRSRTHTETWPARIYNIGNLQFEANKRIVLGETGLQVAPATAHADGRNRLVDVETPLDPVPLVSTLLHDWVRSQHQKTAPRALAQIKSKTVRTVKRRMDRQVDPKLLQLEQRFRDTVLSHLEPLTLVAEPVELYTTEQRAVMRLRLAREDQLAAHSLRPLAPSDSWMSLQVNQSALNNSLAGFELEGRRLTVGQLFDLVTEKLLRTDVPRPDDLPDRVMVEFSPHDAIRVACQDGRLELVLGIRELAHGRDKIRNFQVHAYFRPEIHGLRVTLVRDGTLQFAGHRLRAGPRMVLYGVFGKLLRKDQQLLLLGQKIQQDPRLDGLMLTQFTLDNGWIGASWGPKTSRRVAWRDR